MPKSSIHTDLLSRKPTSTLARTLSPRALIIGGVLAVALISATYEPRSTSIGEAAARKSSVDLPRRAVIPAVEFTKIVPADPHGTGTPWSPLTGDGSN